MSITLPKELSVLNEITELLLGSNTTVASFLKNTLQTVNKIIPSDLSFVGIVEESDDAQWVVVRDPANDVIGAESGEWQRYINRLKVGGESLLPEERSLVGYVAHKKEPCSLHEVRTEQYYRTSNAEIRAAVAVPILFHGEVLAVINLESKTPGFFTKDHETLLVLTARLVAPHLHSLMLGEGWRRPFLEILQEVTDCVASVGVGIPLEATDALNKIAEILANCSDSGLCEIWTRQGEHELALHGLFAKRDVFTTVIPGEEYAERAVSERRLIKLGHDYARPSHKQDLIPALVVPIVISGDPLGAIVLAFRQSLVSETPGYYTGADETLIQSVQGHLAAAMAFKRHERAKREESYERSRQLSEIAAIFTEVELSTVLQKAVLRVPSLCKSRYCSVFLWDEFRKQFVCRASNGMSTAKMAARVYKPGEGLTGWVGLHGKPLLLDSRSQAALAQVAPDLVWRAKFSDHPDEQDFKLHPFAAVPIFGDGQVIGVLRVTGRTEGSYTEADELLMTAVAGKIAAAIDYSRTYEERIQLLRGLQRLMASISAFPRDALDIGKLKQRFLEEAASCAREIFNADLVVIYSVADDKLDYPPIWKGELQQNDMMRGAFRSLDIPSLIFSSSESRFWADALSEPLLRTPAEPNLGRARFVEKEGVVSSAAIRLKVGETPVGVMFLNFRRRCEFHSERKELIEAFGTQVALSLETIALYEHIRESASREESEALAYELHDVTAILATGVVARAGSILDRLHVSSYRKSAELKRDLRSLEKNAANCVFEIRGIMSELRRSQADIPAWYDLLQNYLNELGRSDRRIGFQPGDRIKLPAATERQVYLIARELVNNALIHSQAKRISIFAETTAGRLKLTVEDNGVGFDPKAVKGLGLLGIRRRVKILGGTLEIHSVAGDTQVIIDIPIPHVVDDVSTTGQFEVIRNKRDKGVK